MSTSEKDGARKDDEALADCRSQWPGVQTRKRSGICKRAASSQQAMFQQRYTKRSDLTGLCHLEDQSISTAQNNAFNVRSAVGLRAGTHLKEA